jgi:hypothetical protein
MRLPSLAVDFWQLRSGEKMHREHPETFEIPAEIRRRDLQLGQAARLIFDIESEDEPGRVFVQAERMWVLVVERVGEQYVGLRTNKPAVEGEGFYLRAAAEVPFEPDHVIGIDDPPQGFVRVMLSEPPTRTWPRT